MTHLYRSPVPKPSPVFFSFTTSPARLLPPHEHDWLLRKKMPVRLSKVSAEPDSPCINLFTK